MLSRAFTLEKPAFIRLIRQIFGFCYEREGLDVFSQKAEELTTDCLRRANLPHQLAFKESG